MRRGFSLRLATLALLVILEAAATSCTPGQAGDEEHGRQAASSPDLKRFDSAATSAPPRPRALAAAPVQRGLEAPARVSPPGEFTLDPGDAEWTLSINNRAGIEIRYRGVPVVTSLNQYWARNFAWASPEFKVVSRTPESLRIDGTAKGLGLTLKGLAQPVSARELRLDFDLVASEAMPGIVGGGMTWKLQLQSPAFTHPVGVPTLFPGKTGWRWPVGEGQEIAIRFEEPIPKLYFEKNQKSEIRTNFVADDVRPGRSRISMTVSIPEGGRITGIDEERYAKPGRDWFRQPLAWDASPVDLAFLNAADRPAGRHGAVKVDGDRLVFDDGAPARFWGANLAGPALFMTPRENIPRQAHRMAQLGYNLVRIHQQDADWVSPNIFGKNYLTTRHLDPHFLDMLDYWIKCLKDEGIYVWLDMHYRRPLKPGDDVTLGQQEIAREKNQFWGFNYVNPQLQKLMLEFQRQYLGRVNRYTRVAYMDEPAIIGILITNENDLTFHFGLRFLPTSHNPVHQALFEEKIKAFVDATGMPANRLRRTWEPGPSKYLLSDAEHQFNEMMIGDLRGLGVKAPIATTNLWGQNLLYSLPPLTDGDVIDVHSYGEAEALSADPRYQKTFPTLTAMAHVHGKPLTITEWNIPYPAADRFTTPLYMASIAALQGWDAPMIYNYSQRGLVPPGQREWQLRIDKWSTYLDPATTGVMPAAAIAFRRGHIRPATKSYYLKLTPEQLLDTARRPDNTAAIRTLVEQSKLTIGIPAIKQLPWLKPTEPSEDLIIVSDPDQSFIPADASSVRSDTGELVRNWKKGIQLIDTPRTQAVSGWIGGKTLELKDATFQFKTPKAVVALTSIDDEPLANSRFILITTIAQARPSPAMDQGKLLPGRPANHLPFLTEPVVGTVTLRTKTSGLDLLCLGPDGKVVNRIQPPRDQDALTIQIPSGRGTHWYVLKVRPPEKTQVPAR